MELKGTAAFQPDLEERDNEPEITPELYSIASLVMEFIARIDRDYEKKEDA